MTSCEEAVAATRQNANTDIGKMAGAYGQCYLCKVQYSSAKSAEQHVQSSRHTSRLKQLGMPNQTPCSEKRLCLPPKSSDVVLDSLVDKLSTLHLSVYANSSSNGSDTQKMSSNVFNLRSFNVAGLLKPFTRLRDRSLSGSRGELWNYGRPLIPLKHRLENDEDGCKFARKRHKQCATPAKNAVSSPDECVKLLWPKHELHSCQKERSRPSSEAFSSGPSDKPVDRYVCQHCMASFDSTDLAEHHSESHSDTRQRQVNPSRTVGIIPAVDIVSLSPKVKTSPVFGDGICGGLTTSKARSYQLELFEKAMHSDSVCFLPTGTGKTLVSAMVISRMLQLNPQHTAVFLVDKILLALQQCKALKQQLETLEFFRWDCQTNSLTKRRLRIAMLCGERKDVKASEVRNQDIIVATAGYYHNLVLTGRVSWAENCVAVFDEVHHCRDHHVYCRVLRDSRHSKLVPGHRPKLLGLTASPAGSGTVEATVSALRRLLDVDFGPNTQLICVEENVAELNRFRSTAQLTMVEVEYSTKERNRASLSNGNTNGNSTNSVGCDSSRLQSFQLAVNYWERDVMRYYEDYMPSDSVSFFTNDYSIQQLIRQESFLNNGQNEYPNDETLSADSSTFQRLVKELVTWRTSSDKFLREGSPIALVIVEMRRTAHTLTRLLRHNDDLQNLRVQTVHIIGHGKNARSAADSGMSVREQDTVIRAIWRHEYHVVVATSVAEEGVDLPECDLVVRLDSPPDCVRALVQVRGRARKQGGRLVVFCRPQDGKQRALEKLLEQERNMDEAAGILLKEQRQATVV